MEILFHLQCWLWQSIMMEISGDLCEWEEIQGNLLGDNTLPPSPFFLSPAPEWRSSPLVSEGEGPRCAGSPENVVRAASPLRIGEGRRERGGEEQEVSLSTPLLPRFPSLPLSLSHYLFLSLGAVPLIILPLCLSGSHTHSGVLTSQLPTHKWLH